MPVRRTASRASAAATTPGGTRADNGVKSYRDDRDGEEADIAYEAVAHLTVLAGSGNSIEARIDPQNGDRYVGAALSELYVIGQDLCYNLIWQIRALAAPSPPA